MAFETAAQELVQDLNWDGSLSQTKGDYLMPVSTNLGGGKSDAYIHDLIDHRAEIGAQGQIVVTAKITRTNTAPASDSLGYLNNVDYFRLYVPQGAQLLEAGGFRPPSSELFKQLADGAKDDLDLLNISGATTIDNRSGTRINNELGKTVFANWLQTAPGETETVYFRYQLPQSIKISSQQGANFLNYFSPDYAEVDDYSLLIEQQSGKRHSQITSTVILPDNYRVVWHQSLDDLPMTITNRLASLSQPLERPIYYSLLIANN